jgi:thiol-disulfide isomerase/thioredoxin
MSKKYLLASGVVVIIALSIFYAGYSSVLNKDSAPVRAVKTNTPIEPFSARYLDDSDFTFTPSDKVVVYEVFASWCIPCRQSVPEVLDFAERNEDVDVVGIAYRDVSFEIEKFQEEYGEFETVVMSNGAVEDALQIRSVPQTIFVVNDEIRYRVFGNSTVQDLEEILGLVERELA